MTARTSSSILHISRHSSFLIYCAPVADVASTLPSAMTSSFLSGSISEMITVKNSIIFLSIYGLLSACNGGAVPDTQKTSQNEPSSENPTPPQKDKAETIEEEYSPVTQYENNYCQTNAYPPQWTWNPHTLRDKPLPAVSGTPRITQIRNGKIIAVYNNFGGDAGYSKLTGTDEIDTSVGPFRRAPYQQWKNGDVFEIDPAIYSGSDMQIYIGPNSANGLPGTTEVPANITIRGKTVNGFRPVIVNPPNGASNSTYNQSLVYVEGWLDAKGNYIPAANVTIENIDIVDSPAGGYIGKAAVYVNGARDLTLRNVRIAGFRQHSANGVFATSANSGTLLLENVELDDNGGDSGPEHNAYINASRNDPSYTFRVVGSWSRNAYYGHLLKSRAQRTIIEGSYLMGSRATPGKQAEAYLLDVPDGGVLEVRNSIFVKNYSGNFSNGASLTFGVESASQNDEWNLTIEHNTFVALSRYYDDEKHSLYPIFLLSGFRGTKVIDSNLFVGYCLTGDPAKDERGSNPAILTFNDIDLSFRPRAPIFMGRPGIIGTPGYGHNSFTVIRKTNAIGARD